MNLRYTFTWPDQTKHVFEICLDDETLELLPKPRESYPEWTRLSNSQCCNCPLKESEHPRCPIAANVIDVVEFGKDLASYEVVDLEITGEARSYRKNAPVQNGLSSLVGIYMVTSGCPVMDKLRPMVRTHLPFATPDETTFRLVSNYLLAQYFRHKNGLEPDWEMRSLPDLFKEIHKVNVCFKERIAEVHTQDAGLNAVIRLDTSTHFTLAQLVEDGLADLEQYFAPYLVDEPASLPE